MQHNRLQPPWHLLESIWCPIMADDLSVERIVTLAATAPVHSVTRLATSPMTALTKSIHQEHLATTTGHVPSCVITTTIETDHSPVTTGTATEDILTGHDHTTDRTMTETLTTTKNTHPAPHPTTKAAHTSLEILIPLIAGPWFQWHSHWNTLHWCNCN